MKMKKKSERWQTVEYTDVWEAYLEETLPGNITPWKKAIGFFDRGTGIAYVPIKNETFRMDSSDCGIRAFIPGTSESAAGK